jgi:hypothetical protein
MDSQELVVNAKLDVSNAARALIFASAPPIPEHVATIDSTDIYAKYAAALGASNLTNEQRGEAILAAIVEAVGHE